MQTNKNNISDQAFDLAKSKDRGHILEGLTIALSNIDSIIDLHLEQ